MSNLNKLFCLIKHFNRYANAELINEDENYYFYKINNGYVTEILKSSLNKMNVDEIAAESKYILRTY
tara:strand:- start:66 stop:266 length:201 start_codon:yes stop_codon:yes gene_type:complete